MTPALAEGILALDFPKDDAVRIEELNVRANEGQLTERRTSGTGGVYQYRRSPGLLAVEGPASRSSPCMNEFAREVRRRASDRCEYCQLPQSAFWRPFHIEHIVARQHGGLSRPDNLALACWNCNLKKGLNLSGIDPGTGRMAALFNPRGDLWDEHFLPGWRPGAPRRRDPGSDAGWKSYRSCTWAE
jgi:hypothetical protein